MIVSPRCSCAETATQDFVNAEHPVPLSASANMLTTYDSTAARVSGSSAVHTHGIHGDGGRKNLAARLQPHERRMVALWPIRSRWAPVDDCVGAVRWSPDHRTAWVDYGSSDGSHPYDR